MSPSICGRTIATLLFSLLSAACTTKVSTSTIKGPGTESRTRIEPSGALGKSTWHWDGHGFTGNIEWQSCRIETTWKETEQSVTATRPGAATPYLVIAAGAALAITGLAIYDYDGVEETCTYGVCYDEEVSNLAPLAFMLSGGVTIGTGVTLLKVRPKVALEIKDLETVRKSASENGPCIQPKDLGELKLVLQIAERKFVTIRVNRDWSARIEIPPGIELPRNVDLPVLVYEVPHNVSRLVGRWHVIGYARAGTEAAPREGT